MVEVETSDLLVEDLGQDIDANIELASLGKLNILLSESLVVGLVQHDLGKDLVGEGARHDERGMAGSTAKVDETSLGQQDDVAAVLHQEAVNLGLDVLHRGSVGLQPGNVNLDIEVTNVWEACQLRAFTYSERRSGYDVELTADNGIVGHGLKVLASQDVTATSGGDKDLTNLGGLLHGGDLVTSHGGLEGVDGINLGNNDTGTHAVQGHGTALADITETGHNGDLASNHDIGSALDTINKGLTATVQVVELGLGDAVVDIDGGDKQLAILEHAVKVVDTSSGLLGDTIAVLEHLRVLGVDKAGQVTAIVEDQVELGTILEGEELLLETPVVLLFSLSLPGKDRDTGSGNGSGGMVLSAEDVAAGPGDFGTKSSQGLDEDSGLDSHVQAACNACALERLVLGVLLTGGHETGHLVLGELDLLAAKGGERQVSDLELLSGSSHCSGEDCCDGWEEGETWMEDKEGGGENGGRGEENISMRFLGGADLTKQSSRFLQGLQGTRTRGRTQPST